jgi:hypothetical protein
MVDKTKATGIGRPDAEALHDPFGPPLIAATRTEDLFSDIPVQGPPGTSNDALNNYYNSTIQGKLLQMILGMQYGAPKRIMPNATTRRQKE